MAACCSIIVASNVEFVAAIAELLLEVLFANGDAVDNGGDDDDNIGDNDDNDEDDDDEGADIELIELSAVVVVVDANGVLLVEPKFPS